MNQSLNSGFKRTKRAAGRALDRANHITERKSNPLSLYEKLQPVQFDIIAQVYGQDALLRYIKTMEAKRMRGK